MSKIIKFNPDEKDLLNIAFDIRRKVFIEEQKVSEEEEFEFEDECTHFLIYHKKQPVGTSRYRITEKGIKLERFALLKEARGKGIGYDLLRFTLNDARQFKKHIYLNAQASVVNFYKQQGFIIDGEKFIEANIIHYPMSFENPHNLHKAIEKAVCRR
ncbi:MAG: GNAT family N-acetyltransferase [Bacteroidetes bacterium]|nr:MAG: GNAT family N-acetyltransferase [Bacteroidota bacterium]